MKKFAIIGFGGLGKVHFGNLIKIEAERKDIKLVAICNDDLDAIRKTVVTNISAVSVEDVDFSKYNLYDNYKKMLENEELDFVFVALPTWLHCEVCVYCLEHGVDVYTEKPMAINPEECSLMKKTAERYGRRLMVGHCLRFSDEYIFLKRLLESGEYGKAVKAEFSRKSPLPMWSFGGWLLDEKRSGGVIVDLHVHDVDVINWLFGKPEKISVLSNYTSREYASIYALFGYENLNVSVIADWGLPSSYKFTPSYAVTFEKAYIENLNGDVTVYTNDGIIKPEFENGDCYYREVSEFIDSIIENKPFVTADIDSVYESMELLFKEKEFSK